MSCETLKDIRIKQREDSGDCLREMLIVRLEEELSKEEIVAALDTAPVGRSSLAREVEKTLWTELLNTAHNYKPHARTLYHIALMLHVYLQNVKIKFVDLLSMYKWRQTGTLINHLVWCEFFHSRLEQSLPTTPTFSSAYTQGTNKRFESVSLLWTQVRRQQLLTKLQRWKGTDTRALEIYDKQ